VRLDLDERFDLLGSLPFVCMHIACLLAVWTGVSAVAVVVCLTLYVVRMFGITAGYHRYFSHRSYKTSRASLSWGSLARCPLRRDPCGGQPIIDDTTDIQIPRTMYIRRSFGDSGGLTSGGFSAENTARLTFN